MAITLLEGPPRYVATTPWRPLAALIATVAIVLGMQIAAFALAALRPGAIGAMAPESDSAVTAGLVIWLALSQASIVLLTLWAAGRFGGREAAVLQIERGRLKRGDILWSLLGLVVIVGAFNMLIFWLWPEDLLRDLRSFLPMLDGPQWPITVIAITVGAPLSEELLFRGFLLSALAHRGTGFWPAALVVNTIWTALHYGYSLAGLAEVFFAGLYLSWLLWRTGSLWPPLLCHAFANAASLLMLLALK